jgi:hypothetical protein
MTRSALVTASLAACTALALPAAEPATAALAAGSRTEVRSGVQPILFAGSDLKQVAKVRFFASNNGGGSWTPIGETTVDTANPVAPKLDFRAPSDGTWHFLTTAVLRDGRAEPEPAPGKLPPNALAVVIDNTPPEVQEVQATVDQVGDGYVTVGVTWRANDANFAGISVEVSGDGGRTFVSGPGATPAGYLKMTVPRTLEAATMVVRVTARDLAGNSTPSAPRQVPIPLPADPDKALALAVERLPSPSDLEPVEKAPAKPLEKPTEKVPAKPVVETVKPPAAKPAEAAPVESKPAVDKPVPGKPADRRPPRQAPAPAAGFLTGAAALDVLEDARGLAAQGDSTPAVERYQRLLDSDQAEVAAEEALALLLHQGDQAAAVALGDGLATELRSDAVRCLHGRALITLGRADQALRAVAPIARSSPRAREALLIVARGREAQGRRGEATRLYAHLAEGGDAVAAEARQLLGK